MIVILTHSKFPMKKLKLIYLPIIIFIFSCTPKPEYGFFKTYYIDYVDSDDTTNIALIPNASPNGKISMILTSLPGKWYCSKMEGKVHIFNDIGNKYPNLSIYLNRIIDLPFLKDKDYYEKVNDISNKNMIDNAFDYELIKSYYLWEHENSQEKKFELLEENQGSGYIIYSQEISGRKYYFLYTIQLDLMINYMVSSKTKTQEQLIIFLKNVANTLLN
jgi:hypothetical protein